MHDQGGMLSVNSYNSLSATPLPYWPNIGLEPTIQQVRKQSCSVATLSLTCVLSVCVFSLCVFSLCVFFLCSLSVCFLSVFSLCGFCLCLLSVFFCVCVFSLCFPSAFSLCLSVCCLCFLIRLGLLLHYQKRYISKFKR